jgi:hypothetical protein
MMAPASGGAPAFADDLAHRDDLVGAKAQHIAGVDTQTIAETDGKRSCCNGGSQLLRRNRDRRAARRAAETRGAERDCACRRVDGVDDVILRCSTNLKRECHAHREAVDADRA